MFAKDFFQGFGENAEAKFAFDAFLAAFAHFAGLQRIGKQSVEAGGKLNGVAMLHEVAGDAVGDDLRSAAMSASDNRLAEGHGFEIHQAKSFAATG